MGLSFQNVQPNKLEKFRFIALKLLSKLPYPTKREIC